MCIKENLNILISKDEEMLYKKNFHIYYVDNNIYKCKII